MLNKKEQKVIGRILHVAKDKRSHVMIPDCLSWMEVKMKEVKRLAAMLPNLPIEDSDEDKYPDICYDNRKGYFDKVSAEFPNLLLKMRDEICKEFDSGYIGGIREFSNELFDEVLYKKKKDWRKSLK